MLHTRSLWIAAALFAAAGAGAAGATLLLDAGQDPMEPPKPGPELEILKADAGEWNASLRVWMVPGQPPMEMAGSETNAFECNGLWMRTEFEMADGSFSGRGLSGWDAVKKKYVNVWVDSWTTHLSVSLGTYDKEKKVMTFHGEQPDPATGKMSKVRSTVEYLDANKRRYSSWTTPPGGAESQMLEITYTRAE